MERAEALSDISEPLSQGHLQALTRKQKRVLRQKKAKLYKQGDLQVSYQKIQARQEPQLGHCRHRIAPSPPPPIFSLCVAGI